MMKKFVLAVGFAATLGCASAAHAGYYETFNSFEGSFQIDSFRPDRQGNFDHKFNISLTKLDGTVSLQIPSPGTYGASITPGSSLSIDYDGILGADLSIGPLPVAVPIGGGTISGIAGLGGVRSMNFDFSSLVSTFVLDHVVLGFVPVFVGTSRHVDVSGSGATSLFAALLGIPGFLTGNVSGTLGVDILFKQDELDFTIDGSQLLGTDLEAVLLALDFNGNNDGKIDGTFAVNGSVHIPEPGSLALLGLGLVGLVARRRKAVKAV